MCCCPTGKWVFERPQDHFLEEDDKEDDKSSPATYVLAHSDWGYPSSMITLQMLKSITSIMKTLLCYEPPVLRIYALLVRKFMATRAC
jgi:hypothetical protein